MNANALGSNPHSPHGGRPDMRAMRFGEHAKPKDVRGTLVRLIKLTRDHWGKLLLVFGFSAIVAAAPVITPLLIGHIIDAIGLGNPAGTLFAILLGVYLGDWFSRFCQQRIMVTAGQYIIRDIRLALFRAIEGLPLCFFDKHRHGELMSRITNDVDNISTTISTSLSQLMVYAFTICGTLTAMISQNLVLTGVALGAVALILLFARFITAHTRPLFKEQQKVLGGLNAHIEESITGFALVKAFCKEENMVEEFDKLNKDYLRVAMKAQVWSGLLMPFTAVINNLSFISIAIVGGVMAAQGVISVGVISTFLLYSKQFTRPFVDIANIYNTLQSALAGAERIFEIMDQEPEPAGSPQDLACPNPQGHIEFRDVSFAYEPGQPVLTHITLDIPAGTRVAIVGETGSGKTTLIKLLARFYDVSSGAILLDGHDLREYRLDELRRSFGTVLQDPVLFTASVVDNLCYGINTSTMTEDQKLQVAQDAARACGAHAFIMRLPLGYQTVLENAGAGLSQGERQLLTIARAMVANAPLLILDEATSSVDTVTEQSIRKALLSISKDRTSVVIAHRLTTIRDSDLIVVLNNGEITQQGTHKELLAQDGEYAQMWHAQTEG